MTKGIIFDLDGVIVYTDKFHFRAWKQMAEELGFALDEQVNHRLRGVSRMDSLNVVLEGYEGEPLSEEEKQKWAERKNDIYRSFLATMTPADVTDEVRETLAELHKRGYRLAVGSSSKNARLILDKIALTDVFDAISDGNNITKSKPEPEVFLKAAEYIKLRPEECLVVEDAYAGIDAARAGNMKSVGIGEASEYGKADYHIKTLKELLYFL